MTVIFPKMLQAAKAKTLMWNHFPSSPCTGTCLHSIPIYLNELAMRICDS